MFNPFGSMPRGLPRPSSLRRKPESRKKHWIPGQARNDTEKSLLIPRCLQRGRSFLIKAKNLKKKKLLAEEVLNYLFGNDLNRAMFGLLKAQAVIPASQFDRLDNPSAPCGLVKDSI